MKMVQALGSCLHSLDQVIWAFVGHWVLGHQETWREQAIWAFWDPLLRDLQEA